MSTKLFTNEEQEELRKNRYVKKVSEKGITYNDEFKSHAISESLSGKTSTQIFKEAGFDISMLALVTLVHLKDGKNVLKSMVKWVYVILEKLIQVVHSKEPSLLMK